MANSNGNSGGCGPTILGIICVIFVLGLIGQACGIDSDDGSDSYHSDSGCYSAAQQSNRANGYDVESEYEACTKLHAITGD